MNYIIQLKLNSESLKFLTLNYSPQFDAYASVNYTDNGMI